MSISSHAYVSFCNARPGGRCRHPALLHGAGGGTPRLPFLSVSKKIIPFFLSPLQPTLHFLFGLGGGGGGGGGNPQCFITIVQISTNCLGH